MTFIILPVAIMNASRWAVPIKNKIIHKRKGKNTANSP